MYRTPAPICAWNDQLLLVDTIVISSYITGPTPYVEWQLKPEHVSPRYHYISYHVPDDQYPLVDILGSLAQGMFLPLVGIERRRLLGIIVRGDVSGLSDTHKALISSVSTC